MTVTFSLPLVTWRFHLEKSEPTTSTKFCKRKLFHLHVTQTLTSLHPDILFPWVPLPLPTPRPACSHNHWSWALELKSCQNLGTYLWAELPPSLPRENSDLEVKWRTSWLGSPLKWSWNHPASPMNTRGQGGCPSIFTVYLSKDRFLFQIPKAISYLLPFSVSYSPSKEESSEMNLKLPALQIGTVRHFFPLWIGLSIASLQKSQLCKLSRMQGECRPPSAGNLGDPLEGSAIILNEVKRWKCLHWDL